MEFDFSETIEIKWPEKGDNLFKADRTNWEDNAYVGWSGIDTDAYCKGFKELAEIGAARFLEDYHGRDCYIFPIIYLYRHYTELRLKSILFNGRQLLNNNAAVPTVHKLMSLWPDCRKLLEEIWPNEEKDPLDAAEALIVELDNRDQQSTNYRYPTDKTGNPSVVEGERIDVRNLVEIMNRLSSFLDSCDNGIAIYLSYKREMEACT